MLLEHNVKVYKNMTTTLKKKGCCCVVMGTGVGKTYVTSEYLDNNDYKALVVSPRHSINQSWERHTGRVETITYQKLAGIYKDIDYSKYNLLICDEVHHIGAPKWGKPIKYIIDNNLIKVLGLTESSIRYTDGGRDVAHEFFNGNVVYGESVPSAIKKQILNPVTYVGAMYNSDGLKKTLRGKIQSRLYAKLNLAINKTPTVTEIFRNNMPSGKRKGIIFASTISDMKFAMEFVKSVYPQATIKVVHSKQSDMINEENMDWFKNADEGYLCSVDMISEGVHIKGVNTLIMLRRTESPNLFNQQLGRCLDASKRDPAILFDLVNNQYSIKIVKNKVHIKLNNLFNTGVLNVVPSEQLIVKDYRKDIIEVFEEIQNSLDVHWTNDEIEFLTKHYKVDMSSRDLVEFLPRHTAIAIERKAGYLGLSDAGFWTKEEVELLKKWFPINREKCFKLLKKSRGAIISKAGRLGLSGDNGAYSAEEDAIIIKYHDCGSERVVAELEAAGFKKRSAAGVRARARKLGFKVIPAREKQVMCVETGKVYKNCCEAERDTHVQNTLINQAVRGKRNVAGGYHWKYVQDLGKGKKEGVENKR